MNEKIYSAWIEERLFMSSSQRKHNEVQDCKTVVMVNLLLENLVLQWKANRDKFYKFAHHHSSFVKVALKKDSLLST